MGTEESRAVGRALSREVVGWKVLAGEFVLCPYCSARSEMEVGEHRCECGQRWIVSIEADGTRKVAVQPKPKAKQDAIWRCDKCLKIPSAADLLQVTHQQPPVFCHTRPCSGRFVRHVWNGGEYVPEEKP